MSIIFKIDEAILPAASVAAPRLATALFQHLKDKPPTNDGKPWLAGPMRGVSQAREAAHG